METKAFKRWWKKRMHTMLASWAYWCRLEWGSPKVPGCASLEWVELCSAVWDVFDWVSEGHVQLWPHDIELQGSTTHQRTYWLLYCAIAWNLWPWQLCLSHCDQSWSPSHTRSHGLGQSSERWIVWWLRWKFTCFCSPPRLPAFIVFRHYCGQCSTFL